MQIKVYTIPLSNNDSAIAECNAFLRSVRVLALHREFVNTGPHSFWSVFVEYLDDNAPANKKNKKAVDYKEVLSESDFEIFSRLRVKRKELAEREGVPIYLVFTNEQLAGIVTKQIKTIKELENLDGVGKNKADKWGEILDIVSTEDK
ncbi:HRDC domain-containing protein [Desulfobacter latus]|uniref:HRDC domain-containing protein n=1 Tax=Desulfobacter latus TaxID=2292 RepID=A0A850T141_9BACT|nr:HRDC domain-containing protein [Desulfobacter latus]NWH04811.1 HRDC domain-containing protein [Desulfobacter latus]